jgi:hypothetical protein
VGHDEVDVGEEDLLAAQVAGQDELGPLPLDHAAGQRVGERQDFGGRFGVAPGRLRPRQPDPGVGVEHVDG